MRTIDQFLADVRGEGVQVWVEGDELRLRAPKGRLTPELRLEIANRKRDILRILGSPGAELDQDGPIAKAPRDGDLPLGPAQQRLWFLDQYDDQAPIYAIPTALRLRGILHPEAFRTAIEEIVRRHEVLRTAFPARNGRPVQRILASGPAPIAMVDLQGSPRPDRETEIIALAAEEIARPFDLAEGPLWRVTLIRVAEDDHVFLLNMHHIISDGWSVGVLVREFSEVYTAASEGRPHSLPDLAIQYADFSAWQRGHFQGEAHRRRIAYWKKQLAGATPLLELPWDRPRPATLTHRGGIETIELGEALTARLKALAVEAGASLYMALLAGFTALLSRYSGQEDIVVGSAVANRSRREVEPLIGFFVNTLVMRTDVSGRPTFRELLARVKSVALDAFAHQDLAFEELMEHLQPERSLSYSPFFQVMLILQNAPMTDLDLAGLKVSMMTLPHETAKFDMILVFVDEGTRLVGSLEYNTDLFDASTIRRMLRHLATLLEAAVEQPDRPVTALSMLSTEERRQLLFDWNDTTTPYPRRPIAELFEEQVAATPHAVAAEILGDRLTYEELNDRADGLAVFLQNAGLGPEDCVGVCVERSFEMIVALLGILKAGAAYVPLAPEHPHERLSIMIADAGVKIILAQNHLLSSLPEPRPETVVLDTKTSWPVGTERRRPRPLATIDSLAYVMYTSGSTGTPKGVAVPQRGIVRLVRETNFVNLGPDVVAMAYAPLSFDASTLEIWAPLLNGGRLVLMPPRPQSLDELCREIRERAVNTVWMTTGLFQLMVDHRIEAFGGVCQLLAGGDILSQSHVERILRHHPRCIVVNGYGPTENTTLTACHRMNSSARFDGSVPIGRPISNTTVYILDEHREPVPVGVAGELYTGGDGLARGYVNDEGLTAERFVAHPFSSDPGARLYRTGDRARYRPDGCVEFLGRIDQQVKLRGFRIELGEIDAALSQHPAVCDAVTVVREVSSGDKRLIGYFVGSSRDLTANQLREFLQAKLPDYMIPSAFVRMETLPLTKNGKVDRRALPKPEATQDATQAPSAPPRTPIEEIVAAIWGDVLGLPAVGVLDNFFGIGGHSLLATQVVSRIRDAFQVDLPLRELFEAPTVAGLADRIGARRDGPSLGPLPPIVPISHDRPLPLSHAQERLWFLEQLSPGNVSYNIPSAYRCSGRLNLAALRRFLNELVRRHSSLRTTFGRSTARPSNESSRTWRSISIARDWPTSTPSNAPRKSNGWPWPSPSGRFACKPAPCSVRR